MKTPKAKKIAKELTIHNHTRTDNYYWLNDRKDQEVLDYLNAENNYTDDKLKHTTELQSELYEEIIGRLDKNEQSVPYLSDGYYYSQRYEEGKEYPIFGRKKGSLTAKEEVLIDQNELAQDQTYCGIGKLGICSNNKILAYSVDFVSRRLYTIYFENLETGEILEDEIPNTSGGFAWALDGKTIFYTQKDEQTLRSNKVFKHVLGTNSREDIEVFCEEEDAFISSVYRSKSKDYIIIGSYSTISTEFRILKTDDPNGEFKLFEPRKRDHEYSIDHKSGKFFVVTNLDAAKNFKLMECDEENTTSGNWKEVMAHRDDVLIESIEIFNNFLVIDERKGGLTQFRVMDQINKSEHVIDMGEESYMAYMSTNVDFDTNLFRFGFTSLKTPSTIFDYNLESKTKDVKKVQAVIGGHNPEEYTTKRVEAKAEDGTMIPMSIVYKKGTELNGESPTLLYGYGSYGHVVDPSFSPARLSLLDRGFVFAIAHIRGGEDLGRHWYEDGKMLNKINTFTDFISCGEFLIEQNYTNSEKLCAMGGSAGGLLMGAIINLKPQIWKAAIAAVPFVDVVTTMLDDTIPLTTGEYDEWGNPNDEEYYKYILSYSPYDQIEAKDYPALLVTTGLHDSQVQYWEPAKWVAKLRELKTDNNNLLLKTNMKTGHGGASGRYEYYKEVALDYAFLLDQVGLV
ncbi:S9 family peptidase [Flavobacteriales bacterium]|nr:S9 family peptidase [Flavobacteriales bacterium]